MLQSSESETEILLGNKQLLGVFFVVVVLLGVAFAGGYKIGQSAGKKALVSAAPSTPDEPPTASASTSSAPNAGETHAFPANGISSEQSETPKPSSAERSTAGSDTGVYHPPSGEEAAPPLGSSSKRAKVTKPVVATAPSAAESASVNNYSPASGQTFLQVAAVGRDEAQAIADVLHKKGFKAHAVPKPGGGRIYRVLIGPIRDSGDLASTRDSLRKTGFREIFVQRY